MGRPKGSKNKSDDAKQASKANGDAAPTAKAEPAPNSQTLSDDQRAALLFQHSAKYTRALKAKKSADAEFKNICKAARADCGKDAVDRIKLGIRLETPEGEAAVRVEIASMLEVARWHNSPVGTQFSMLETIEEDPANRAFLEGKKAALENLPAKPPYDPGSQLYPRWMDGHGEGTTALLRKGIKGADGQTLDEAAAAAPRPAPMFTDDAPRDDAAAPAK